MLKNVNSCIEPLNALKYSSILIYYSDSVSKLEPPPKTKGRIMRNSRSPEMHHGLNHESTHVQQNCQNRYYWCYGMYPQCKCTYIMNIF